MTVLTPTAGGEIDMKILILHMIVGSLVLMGSFEPLGRHELSKRLTALRFRHAHRNRHVHR
jgi:hypothetical protein